MICDVISRCDGVVRADVIDRYEPRQSATFQVEILGDCDLDSVEGGIEAVLSGIGCVRRG